MSPEPSPDSHWSASHVYPSHLPCDLRLDTDLDPHWSTPSQLTSSSLSFPQLYCQNIEKWTPGLCRLTCLLLPALSPSPDTDQHHLPVSWSPHSVLHPSHHMLNITPLDPASSLLSQDTAQSPRPCIYFSGPSLLTPQSGHCPPSLLNRILNGSSCLAFPHPRVLYATAFNSQTIKMLSIIDTILSKKNDSLDS